MPAATKPGMGPVEAWFHCLATDRTLEGSIRRSLLQAGVQLYPIEHAGGRNHGIVCFSEVDEKLLTILRDVRENRQSRVLALATWPSAVPPNLSWRLIHAGASDTIAWQDQTLVASQICEKLERWITIDQIMRSGIDTVALAGDSPTWIALLRTVVEAAHFTSVPLLLVGESGTGKELLARLIHSVGLRADDQSPHHELITVDCSTIIPELSGSELFGHERGAFTHAISAREGAFALADGGTLFLDEIGELPLSLQAQLLRAVQEKTYKRIGGNVWQRTNFRLVCATNRDIAALVEKGQFRLDLYHRIAGWVIRTLPLRERRQDILPLATHFLKICYSSQPTPEIDPPVREYLLNRTYPGNVRELFQLVQRIAHRHVGHWPITVGDIPQQDLPPEGVLQPAWPDEHLETTIANALTLGVGLKEISQTTTDAAIRLAVNSEKGNLQRAARRLGVTDRALQMRRASAKARNQPPSV
jgi:transcriptional regulator with GAF, ATPase, and Fis domain